VFNCLSIHKNYSNNKICEVCKKEFNQSLNPQCLYKHCPTRIINDANNNNNNNNNETTTINDICQSCHNINYCRNCNIILCQICRQKLRVLQCCYCSNFICSQVCYNQLLSLQFRHPNHSENNEFEIKHNDHHEHDHDLDEHYDDDEDEDDEDVLDNTTNNNNDKSLEKKITNKKKKNIYFL